MAKRVGKCVNFGLCGKADSRETIDTGDGADFSCPECGKPLTQTLAAGQQAAAKGGSGKKAVMVGALAVVFAAGGAYKFLVADNKPVVTHDGPNVAVQTTPPPTKPNVEPIPVTPPPPPAPVVDPPRPPRPPVRPPIAVIPAPPKPPAPPVTPDAPAPPKHEEVVETPAPKDDTSSDTMVARLLSPINTKSANEGDRFTAIVEQGPHKGATLTGTVKKLGKSKKHNEIELDFISLAKDGKTIPVNLGLVDISNSKNMKGVDDEGHIIGNSSKKKAGLAAIVGGTVGGVIGKLKGGNKGMVMGIAAGGATGYILTATLVSSAQDLELGPGALMTLKVADR